MANFTRRGFPISAAAASTARGLPQVAVKPAARRILTLVYDRRLGMMRAIDRLVP
ncbi:MAG: Tat pathway signal protein [Pseudomonadota bacterium]